MKQVSTSVSYDCIHCITSEALNTRTFKKTGPVPYHICFESVLLPTSHHDCTMSYTQNHLVLKKSCNTWGVRISTYRWWAIMRHEGKASSRCHIGQICSKFRCFSLPGWGLIPVSLGRRQPLAVLKDEVRAEIERWGLAKTAHIDPILSFFLMKF